MQHMFAFGSFRMWLVLLWENRSVDRQYIGRMLAILLVSFLTTLLRIYEGWKYGRSIAATPIHPSPIFILGYGRSGTTHLHNLLTRDNRFGYVTTFQAIVPDFFLTEQECWNFFPKLNLSTFTLIPTAFISPSSTCMTSCPPPNVYNISPMKRYTNTFCIFTWK